MNSNNIVLGILGCFGVILVIYMAYFIGTQNSAKSLLYNYEETSNEPTGAYFHLPVLETYQYPNIILSYQNNVTTDGIGSQLHRIMTIFAISRHLGCHYLHSGYKTINHGDQGEKEVTRANMEFRIASSTLVIFLLLFFFLLNWTLFTV